MFTEFLLILILWITKPWISVLQMYYSCLQQNLLDEKYPCIYCKKCSVLPLALWLLTVSQVHWILMLNKHWNGHIKNLTIVKATFKISASIQDHTLWQRFCPRHHRNEDKTPKMSFDEPITLTDLGNCWARTHSAQINLPLVIHTIWGRSVHSPFETLIGPSTIAGIQYPLLI